MRVARMKPPMNADERRYQEQTGNWKGSSSVFSGGAFAMSGNDRYEIKKPKF
jgi:hypothetical protein